MKRYLEKEIKILKRVKHKNLIRLVELNMSKNNYYLFFQFWNGGDLKYICSLAGGKLNMILARIITKQLVNGLNYLNTLIVSDRKNKR